MIWLDDQLNGFQGQTFLQVAATTILKIVWCYFELRLFFAFSVKLMRIYLELICSRSKDIGYSLTLQTVSWIIQHLKHHFAVNKEIQEQFFQNHFHFPKIHISTFSRRQPWAVTRTFRQNNGIMQKPIGIMQIFAFSMFLYLFLFLFFDIQTKKLLVPSPPSPWILSGTHHLKLCMARHSYINPTTVLLYTYNKP